MSRKEVEEKLVKLGKKILNDINEKKNPNIEIPIRSLSNIVFDENTRLLKLGDKTAKRYFFNVAQAKSFMQTLLIASFCRSIVKENIHTSIRDMYYNLKRTLPDSDENTFDEQAESDPLIVDLETSLGILREQLHLIADRKGVVAGNVIIEDRGDEIDWSKLGSGGWSIPSAVEDIEFKKVKADFCLIIEKNAGFERLHEDKFWKKHNCILIGTGGQPARGTRRLIKRLAVEHELPVYVMTDSDSYGWYIYSVIKSGSMALAHASDELGTPSVKFIGLTISDIEKYGLQKSTIKATEQDLKRAKELLEYPWMNHKEWKREIKLMLEKKYKAEIEALSAKGLKFLSETYLPEKLEKKQFLP